jgi:hypothetical protein
MKTEIKDQSGKVLFSAEPSGNRLNINDRQGHKLCCVEHNGSALQIKDAKDKVVSEMPTESK